MTTYNKTTSAGTHYTIYLLVENVDTDIVNNKSKVRYRSWITGDSSTSSWGTGNWSINIGGTTGSGSFSYNFGSQKTYYCTGSSTTYATTPYINHNADGTMNISVTFSFTGASLVGSATIAETFALDTIPRASTPAVSNYTITNTTGSLTYTVTSRADFYHKAIWTLGGTSTTVTLGEINATTSSFTIANTALLAKLPARASGSISLEIETYSDSGYTTQIGSATTSATVTVDTSAIKPTTTLGNIAINTTPDNTITVPVAGYSKVQSAFTAAAGSGASGVTTYFSVSNGSMTTTTSTAASGTAVTDTIPASSSNYTLTISAYSKDSRGAVGSTVQKSVTVYGYTPPTATLTAFRTETSSSTTEDGSGLYVYVTFSGTVGASVNGQNSIQTTSCTYTGSISGTATTGAHYALADNQSVTFTLTVTDKVSSSGAVVSVASAAYPLDLYDDGQGTVGAAIGGVAPAGGFAVYVDLHLYEGQKIIIHKTGGTTETHDVTDLFT